MVDKAIIAIGGGEIGRTKQMPDGSIKQYPVETLHIDNKILKLCKNKPAKVLVIGTASHDNDSYFKVIEYHYTARLNCIVSRLDITKNNYSNNQINQIINNTDIIYISGGDTRYMLKKWQETGLDKILISAYENGKIIIGYSAGAICWFDYYDNFDYQDEPNFKPCLLKGLGIIKGLAVPHFDNVSDNNKQIIKSLYKDNNSFYGIDNKKAVCYINEKITFID